MINILRDSRYSIELQFDKVGANGLLSVLESAITGHEMVLEVGEESNILSRSRPVKYLKFQIDNEQNSLTVSKDTVVVKMDEDEIEYCIERLKKCSIGEVFYPTEFCEVLYDKSTFTIYAFLVG